MNPAAPARKANWSAARGRGQPLRLPANARDVVVCSLQQPWKRYRKALKRCQDKFSPKAIHDFRVETRRLLSSLVLLEDFLSARRVAKTQRLLKRHLDLFDDLRDTQVQLDTVAKMGRASSAVRRFRARLREREERFARCTRREIRKVRIGRLAKLISGCREEVEARLEETRPRQVPAVLLRSVARAFRRARQLCARINPADPVTIHRTRVAFKQFRYMVEALAHCVPGASHERLAAMRRYQTMMGNIQDSEVLLKALDRFLRKHEASPDRMAPFRERLLRRRQRLIRAYLSAADRLLEFWPLGESAAGVTPAKTNQQPAPKEPSL